MALLPLAVLLSAAKLVVAPPAALTLNPTASIASRSTPASVSSLKTPEQVEIEDLGGYFKNLNASLSHYCLSLQIKSYYRFKATNTIPPATSTRTRGGDRYDSNNTSSIIYFNYTTTITSLPSYSATISPPCCGQCYIEADEAHAVYWPTPAPQPNVSTIVGANGFTFTSPSVYIVYSNLRASNVCGRAGSVIPNATIPYQAWEVSTYGLDGVETAFGFADLNDCPTKPSSVTSIQIDFLGHTYDACFPSLQYGPDRLRTLEPEWATCVNVGGIIYDPPRALTSVTTLIDTSTIAMDASLSKTTRAIAGALPPSIPKSTGLNEDPFIPKATSIKSSSANWPTSNDPLTPSAVSESLDKPWLLPSNLPQKSSSGPGSASSEITPDSPNINSGLQITKVITSGGAIIGTLPPISKDSATAPTDILDPPGSNTILIGTSTTLSVKDTSGSSVSNPGSSRITILGQTIDLPGARATSVVFGNRLLNPQSPVLTISGTVISRVSGALLVGTSTLPFAGTGSSVPNPKPLRVAVAGQTIDVPTVGATDVAVGASLLNPHNPAVTISGTAISLGSSALLVGTSTIPFVNKPESSLVTVAGQSFNVPTTGATSLAIGTALLKSQSPAVTVSGDVFYLGSSGLAVGTSTLTLLDPPGTTGAAVSTPVDFSIDMETFTINSNGIAIGHTQLTPGAPALTIDGNFVSLGLSDFVYGTKTETLVPITSSSAVELGPAIPSGLEKIGGNPRNTSFAPSSGNGSTIAPFLGTAPRLYHGHQWLFGLVSGAWVVYSILIAV